MMLKKSKEEVLNEIHSRVSGTMQSQLYNLNMRVDVNSFSYQLQSMIALAVTESFRVLIENQYTDDDFERDMTLKP